MESFEVLVLEDTGYGLGPVPGLPMNTYRTLQVPRVGDRIEITGTYYDVTTVTWLLPVWMGVQKVQITVTRR